MKEFNAQTGGRYVYVDDMLNLQELALAFSNIFDDCDSFIISGCEVSETAIKAGYVYLNGKIRYFSGATGITTWPQYLYENNYIENVNYASGGAKTGRNIYSVSAGSSIPTTLDTITGKTPMALTVTQAGGTLMKDAFFGKYALVLNPATLSQVLNGTLKINGALEVTGNIRSIKNKYSIAGAQGDFDASFYNGSLTLQTQYNSSDNVYAIVMGNGTGIDMLVNHKAVVNITDTGASVSGSVQANLGVFGGIGIDGGIYNRTSATDNTVVNINMIGYNGETDYFRDTVIGNGKGTAILSLNGKSQTARIDGAVTIASGSSGNGLVLLADKSKSDVSIQKTITWQDSSQTVMGTIGYASDADAIFQITNTLAGISIYGGSNSYIDLGPAIKENGQALSDKYVLVSNFNSTVSTLATVENTYNKEQSDARFSQLTNGFNDYISVGNFAGETLCSQIGAATTEDLSKYASLANCLSDMATNDAKKANIRNNIDVYSRSEAQGKLKDTGWISIGTSLYIRQIGNIVCIQGTLRRITTTGLTAFTIPNNVDPPTYEVGCTTDPWVIYRIYGGSRDCHTAWCDPSVGNDMIGFSLTYMV